MSRAQENYRNTVMNSDWHRKLEFPNGDLVVIHSPTVILHVTSQSPGVGWASGHEVRLMCTVYSTVISSVSYTHQ